MPFLKNYFIRIDIHIYMYSVQFLLIELFGGSISIYSHQAYKNYILKVLSEILQQLIMDWLHAGYWFFL